jgi:adenine/guanine/hypoxanthine permease
MKDKGDGKGYQWFVIGDINGFFGLMFDNMTVLSFLAGILIFAFGYPAEIVYKKMFPGTAFGVLFGDLVYTWMAFQLAKRTGNNKVTAMPLGLDTPSTIGVALVVLGPAFIALKNEGRTPEDAALMTWYIGMATMVMIGIFKLIMSFCGRWVQKIVPQAGLLGSLAGIGLALIGFVPLVDIFGLPIVGMISLGLILYTLVAKIRLPRNIPGVLTAIVVGTALYHIPGLVKLHMARVAAGATTPEAWHSIGSTILMGLTYTPPPHFVPTFAIPTPSLGFIQGFAQALNYLPIALPFAILTVVGGINVTESARVAGDDFNTRDILLTEAIATLIAGICGGVAQSTPYIGQPAYKGMGSRAGYTLLTGLFIGLGGMLGYISFFVELIPRAVLAPILIFVALDIMVQAFLACPARHAPAVAFAFFPTVARLLAIKYGTPDIVPMDRFNQLIGASGKALPEVLVTVALGNGFILTAMLWGGFLAELIDRNLRKSVIYLLILAGLAYFGIIHSSNPSGNMYKPWELTGLAAQIPLQFALSYVIMAVIILLLSFTKESREPMPEEVEHMGVESHEMMKVCGHRRDEECTCDAARPPEGPGVND